AELVVERGQSRRPEDVVPIRVVLVEIDDGIGLSKAVDLERGLRCRRCRLTGALRVRVRRDKDKSACKQPLSGRYFVGSPSCCSHCRQSLLAAEPVDHLTFAFSHARTRWRAA